MHTCISSHGLKRSWRSCPRRVNAGNKNTPSTHHPWRRNVTTLMVILKKRSHTQKSHPKSGEPQRYSWGTKKRKRKEYYCNISFWFVLWFCCGGLVLLFPAQTLSVIVSVRFGTCDHDYLAILQVVLLLLLLLHSPALSLGFTILGKIFAYVTIFVIIQPLR